MANIDNAEKFYEQIATPESIAALNGMLSSRLFRTTASYGVAIAHQMYTNKSRSRYIWYVAYGTTALFSGLAYLASSLPYHLYLVFSSTARSEFSAIWGAYRQGGKEGNLSFAQMMALLVAEVAKHAELFSMLDMMPKAIDQVLDIVLELANAPKGNVSKKDEEEEAKVAGPAFFVEGLIKAGLEAASSVAKNRGELVIKLLRNPKLLNFLPEELREKAKALLEDESLWPEVSDIVKDVLNVLEPAEVMSLIAELSKEEPNEVASVTRSGVETSTLVQSKEEKLPVPMEKLVPILRKVLKAKGLKEKINKFIKKDAVFDLAMNAYELGLVEAQKKKDAVLGDIEAIKASAKKETKELSDILRPVVRDEKLLLEVLNLGEIAINVLNDLTLLTKLYNALPKEKAEGKQMPIAAALAALPIVQEELASEAVQKALIGLASQPALVAMGLEFYKATLKEGEEENFKRAEAAVVIIVADATVVNAAIQLCNAIAQLITIDNLTPILEAYNGKQTQEFLEKDDAPLPVELIMAALPLVKLVLGNPLVVGLLTNEAVIRAIKLYVPEKHWGLIDAVLEPSIIRNVLDLIDVALDLNAEVIKGLLKALSADDTKAYFNALKEIEKLKESKQVKEVNVPVPASLIKAAHPLLLGLLCHKDTRKQLNVLLENKKLNEILSQLLPAELVGPTGVVLANEETVNAVLALLETTLTTLSAEDLMPVMGELVKQKMDVGQVIEKLVPVTKKALESEVLKKQIDVVAKCQGVLDAAMVAYEIGLLDSKIEAKKNVVLQVEEIGAIRASAKKKARELSNILSRLVADKDALLEVLNLGEVALGELNDLTLLTKLYNALPKEKAEGKQIPIAATLAALPIVRSELASKAVQKALIGLASQPALVAMGLAFYKATLKEGEEGFKKAEEAVGILVADATGISAAIQLCNEIAQLLTIDNLTTILEAYNGKQTQEFLEKDDAPLPVELIMAALPLVKLVLGNSLVVGLLTNEAVIKAIKLYIPEKHHGLIDAVLKPSIIGNVLALVDVAVTLELEDLLKALNAEDTKEYLKALKAIEDDPEGVVEVPVPASLIRAAHPLLLELLKKKELTVLLKNEELKGVLAQLLPLELVGSTGAVLANEETVKAVLALLETTLTTLSAEDLMPVMGELVKQKMDVGQVIEKLVPVTKKALESEVLKKQIDVVAKSEGVLRVSMAAYESGLVDSKIEAKKKKLEAKQIAAIRASAKKKTRELSNILTPLVVDKDVLPKVLDLGEIALKMLSTKDLMPAIGELIKQEMDVGQVIEKCVPVLKKVLEPKDLEEQKDFKKQIDAIAKCGGVLDAAMVAYKKGLVASKLAVAREAQNTMLLKLMIKGFVRSKLKNARIKGFRGKRLKAIARNAQKFKKQRQEVGQKYKEKIPIIKASAQKEAEIMKEVLASVIQDRDILSKILGLVKTIVGELHDISAIYNGLQQEVEGKQIPAEAILAALPIVQSELASDGVQKALADLAGQQLLTNMGMAFYQATLKKREKKEFAKAKEAVGILVADATVVMTAIQLCNAIAQLITVDTLKPILEAYNGEQTQSFLTKGEPLFPVELIKAALPLIKLILANPLVKKLVTALLANEAVIKAIKVYVPDKHHRLIDAVLKLSIIRNVLDLIDVSMDVDLEGMLDALNAEDTKEYLKALKAIEDNPEGVVEVPVPASLIRAAQEVLPKLLKNEGLIVLLRNKELNGVLAQLLPAELVDPTRAVLANEETVNAVLGLIETTLTTVPADDLIPVIGELVKQKIDVGQVIEKCVPVLKKALESKALEEKKDLRKQVDIVAKSDGVFNLLMAAYESGLIEAKRKKVKELGQADIAAIKEEVKELSDILWPVVRDKNVLSKVLNLGPIALGELKDVTLLSAVYNALPEEVPANHIATEALLKALPIIQGELASEDMQNALLDIAKQPTLIAMGLAFYKATLKKDKKAAKKYSKAEELASTIVVNATVSTIKLCSAIASALTAENLEPILKVYNGEQTQAFLAEQQKEERDPNAPALPVELIKVSIPLIQLLLADKLVVNAIRVIINRPGMEKVVIALFEQDSSIHKHFLWAKQNIDTLLTLAHAACGANLNIVIDEVNLYLMASKKQNVNIRELDQQFIKKMVSFIPNDSTGLLAIVEGNSILFKDLVNSYPDIPVQFSSLRNVLIRAMPIIKQASLKDTDGLVESLVENNHKTAAINKLNKVIIKHLKDLDVQGLESSVLKVLRSNIKRSFGAELKIYLKDISHNPAFEAQDETRLIQLEGVLNKIIQEIHPATGGNVSMLSEGLDFAKNVLDIQGVIPEFISATLKVISPSDTSNRKLIARFDLADDLLSQKKLCPGLQKLLEAIKMMTILDDLDEKLKIDDSNDLVQRRAKMAKKCCAAFDIFFSVLQEVLWDLKSNERLGKHNKTLENLLEDVIPNNIKRGIEGAGQSIKGIVDMLVGNPGYTTSILPNVISIVVGNSGTVGAVVSLVGNNPSAAVTSAFSYLATKVSKQWEGLHLVGILRSNSIYKSRIKDRIETYISTNNPSHEDNIRKGTFGNKTYDALEINNFVIKKLQSGRDVSIEGSIITSLTIINSTVSSLDASGCNIHNLKIDTTELKECKFLDIKIGNSVELSNVRLDAKAFFELMKSIRHSKRIESISIKGLELLGALKGYDKEELEDAMSGIPSLTTFTTDNPKLKSRIDNLYTEDSLVDAIINKMTGNGKLNKEDKVQLSLADKKAATELRRYIKAAIEGLDKEALKQLVYIKDELVGKPNYGWGWGSATYTGLLQYLPALQGDDSTIVKGMQMFIADKLGKAVLDDKIVTIDQSHPELAASMLVHHLHKNNTNVNLILTASITEVVKELGPEGIKMLVNSRERVIGRTASEEFKATGLIQLYESLSSSSDFSSSDSFSPSTIIDQESLKKSIQEILQTSGVYTNQGTAKGNQEL